MTTIDAVDGDPAHAWLRQVIADVACALSERAGHSCLARQPLPALVLAMGIPEARRGRR